jgi:RNA polymerase sigma-70 factor (ECF subfamily)
MTEGKLLPFRRVQGAIDEMSDRALVSALGEGDRAALGALYDRYQHDVYRFVSRLSRDADADDLVQSVFLEAHRSAPRFRGGSQVKTWLFGIAANLVRNHVRGEQRRRHATTTLATIPASAQPAADDAIGAEQQRRWVAAAVDALTPALKEAYVLCVIEELPGKDAAAVLGIREASLWRRLSDARETMRAFIEELQR